MVLRNVPKTDTFEQQRIEINEIAADLHSLSQTVASFSLNDLVDVTASGAAIQQIIKYNGTEWVLDTDIVSTSFSIQTNAASGGGALSYNNSTAIFQYTPPDLSGFLTSLGSVSAHTDVDTTGAVNGKILKYNGTSWVVADDNVVSASAFVSLTDTPSTFTANKWIKVNAGGTALEWTDAPQTALSSINDINDVTITSAQNDQLLKWNGTNWINFTPGYLTSFTETDPTVPTHVKNITQSDINNWNANSGAQFLNDLSDVSTGTISTGEVLKWNGNAWEALQEEYYQADWSQSNSSAFSFIKNKPTVVTNLNGLSDVNTAGAANNKILKYNGTQWVVADDATSSGTNVTVSDTAPSSPSAGDLWCKSDEGR